MSEMPSVRGSRREHDTWEVIVEASVPMGTAQAGVRAELGVEEVGLL